MSETLPESKGITSRFKGMLDQPGKAGRLKKRLVKEAMVMVALSLVLAGAAFGVAAWSSSRMETRDKLKGEVNKLISDASQLSKKLSMAEKAIPVYTRLFGGGEKLEIALDRRRAAEVIEKLKDEHHFTSLRLTMSPVADMPEGKFKNNAVMGQACDMELTIEALSDEHVLQFLSRLAEELPGKFKISTFSLTRHAVPTQPLLKQIAASGRATLVKAMINLQWMGLKPSPVVALASPKPEEKSKRGRR